VGAAFRITFDVASISLPPLPPAVPYTTTFDADADLAGNVVVAVQAEGGIDVHFLRTGKTYRVSTTMRYPCVRWIDPTRALLVDSRSDIGSEGAAIDESGTQQSHPRIGEAVEDVVLTDGYIVGTYFDEGAFGDDPLSKNGVAVFRRDGAYEWGWNESRSDEIPWVYDCYAAGGGDGDTIGVWIYTQFQDSRYAFGILDIAQRSVRLFQLPDTIFDRVLALTSTPEGVWIFATRSWDEDREERIVAWRPGTDQYTTVSSPGNLTRGLRGGRFLRKTDTGLDLVTVSAQASAPNGAPAFDAGGLRAYFRPNS